MEIIVAFILGAVISGLIVFALLSNAKNKLKEQIIGLEGELKAEQRREKDEKAITELIKKEFASCANEILIEKQKSLQEQNKSSLEVFLTPLKEKIKEFQQKVEQADETGKINTATIKEKIEDLVKQNRLTSDMTEKLSDAISQNSKYRGNLGEMVLEKLLKSSGLIDKKENPKNGNFETQVGFKPADGSGGTRILDAVIYLSEGQKSVIVDSKAPLSQFIDFTRTDDPDEAQKHLSAFMNDVYDRVKELGGKYADLEGLQTPDFTIMFIPFEYPLTYIYSNNKLVEDAMKQNVIIAGPSTLIATLRVINLAWAQKRQLESIQDITKLSKTIYEKSVIFVQKIQGVKTSFETVEKKFDEVFKTACGRGGLLGQVERLKDYGVTPTSELDTKYLTEDIEPALSADILSAGK